MISDPVIPNLASILQSPCAACSSPMGQLRQHQGTNLPEHKGKLTVSVRTIRSRVSLITDALLSHSAPMLHRARRTRLIFLHPWRILPSLRQT
jgi:hypothetical protein